MSDRIRLAVRAPATTIAALDPFRKFLAEEVVKLGPFELLCDSDPQKGIPTVTWRIKEGEDPGYPLYDVADRLRARGWQVPAYPLTGSVSNISVQRILVEESVYGKFVDLFVDGVKKLKTGDPMEE